MPAYKPRQEQAYHLAMQRRSRTASIAVLGVLVLALTTLCVLDQGRGGTRAEQNAVYTDFLNAQLQANDHDYAPSPHPCPLSILGQTVRPRIALPYSQLSVVSPLMRRELYVLSLRRITLAHDLAITAPYRLVTDEYLADIEKNEAAPSCPDYVTFTRVVFNTYKTTAFFYTEHLRCGLCGGGDYIFLRKQQGHWRVADDYSPWVS